MIRVGILGCGKVSQVRHIPEYLNNKEVELAGYFDFSRERAAQMAELYGGKVYESADELLQDPMIDAVSVCTTNNTHADITVKALEAGKDVLCEKPMAVNLMDCERMVKAAKNNGRCLMVDQNQRLARAHVKAKQLIEEDLIGKVVTFKTNFGHGGPETWSITPGPGVWFFDKDKAVMGAMADLGVHKIDLIQYLLDSYIVETTAYVSTLDKKYADGSLIGVDDNVICIYKMANGAVGTMTASWTYYGQEDNSTTLYGTEGIMKIYGDPDCSIKVILKDGSDIKYNIDEIQTNDNQTSSGVIDAFVDAVVNHTEPIIDNDSLLNAMKAVFASLKSAEEGRTIKL
jgi:predicted dehydrogenase